MRIYIKQDHIADGQKGNAGKCPISLAIKDADRNIDYVSTGANSANVRYLNNDYYEFPLPQEACRFVKQFDSGHRVYPFEFELTK